MILYKRSFLLCLLLTVSGLYLNAQDRISEQELKEQGQFIEANKEKLLGNKHIIRKHSLEFAIFKSFKCHIC